MTPWSHQEPPYDGPYDPRVYDPNVYATLSGDDRVNIVKWCRVCMKLVSVDTRPGFQHPHFQFDDEGNLLP